MGATRQVLRWLLALGAPAALALAGSYIVVQQWRRGYSPLLEWPAFFSRVHFVGWLAVVLLGADVLLELLRERPAGEGASQVRPAHR